MRPKVVTLDLQMPGMDGLEVLDRIMHEMPTPVLLLSGVSTHAAEVTLQGLHKGAIDFILKFSPGVEFDPDELRAEIVTKVLLAAKVKVIRSVNTKFGPIATTARVNGAALAPNTEDKPGQTHKRIPTGNRSIAAMGISSPISRGAEETYLSDGRRSAQSARRTVQLDTCFPLVVIGASTGGPVALRELLSRLHKGFPGVVVIVQHMSATFTHALAHQLDRSVALPVQEATEGKLLKPGEVLVAPGGQHLLLRASGRVQLTGGDPIHGHCPSIDVTMQSAAQFFGYTSIGVILSGMGKDGALGLTAIHNSGGKTMVQQPATCVVSSMPDEAIDHGVVDYVASPSELGDMLLNSCQQERQYHGNHLISK